MSNYRAIVTDIASQLAAIPNVGVVHQYERQAADMARFIALFKDASGRICGWEITRRAVSEHQAGAFFRHHQMVLKGYLGLQDANGSSLIFQELIDAVCARFRTAEPPANSTWQYMNGDEPDKSPAQAETINDRMFGAVLCHCAEISLSVTERILP